MLKFCYNAGCPHPFCSAGNSLALQWFPGGPTVMYSSSGFLVDLQLCTVVDKKKFTFKFVFRLEEHKQNGF